MQNKSKNSRIIKTICIFMLGLFISVLAISPVFAESAPGTRVVKATLPAVKKPAVKKTETQMNAPDGNATVSEYSVPNIDSTVQENAAKIWFLGVLGGDREYSASAPVLFKIPESGVTENDAVRFIVLRESLYTASSWAMGMARIESMQKGERGMEALIYLADVESFVSKTAEEMSERFRIEPSVARILAEWKISSEISSGEITKNIRYTTVSKTAPVNTFGALSLGPNSLKELVSSPETDVVKAIAAAKKYKLAYTKPYIENIAFIVRYSSSLNFSPELKKALE